MPCFSVPSAKDRNRMNRSVNWVAGTAHAPAQSGTSRQAVSIAAAVAALLVAAVFVWQFVFAPGDLNPVAPSTSQPAAILDIMVLVFREGLECILVLAAIVAGLTGARQTYRRPIAVGGGVGLLATLLTWVVAVRVLDDISQKVSALQLQAATGLLAVIVLLVVMNWFFHKMYWTGWISLHNRRKHQLLGGSGTRNVLLGMGLLGFSSVYREGVEVVLFLQSYRLKLGNGPVYAGVLLGAFLTGVIAVLTFIVQRKLPYRKMLVFTGVLLAGVLCVMVGEQVQEMQLAHWLTTTNISWLSGRIPEWMQLWFSVFPTVETLAGQALALVLVLGSYFFAERSKGQSGGAASRRRADAHAG
jgi:high-affinity iron transporter